MRAAVLSALTLAAVAVEAAEYKRLPPSSVPFPWSSSPSSSSSSPASASPPTRASRKLTHGQQKLDFNVNHAGVYKDLSTRDGKGVVNNTCLYGAWSGWSDCSRSCDLKEGAPAPRSGLAPGVPTYPDWHVIDEHWQKQKGHQFRTRDVVDPGVIWHTHKYFNSDTPSVVCNNEIDIEWRPCPGRPASSPCTHPCAGEDMGAVDYAALRAEGRWTGAPETPRDANEPEPGKPANRTGVWGYGLNQNVTGLGRGPGPQLDGGFGETPCSIFRRIERGTRGFGYSYKPTNVRRDVMPINLDG